MKIDGSKNIYDVFLAKPICRAVRPALITRVEESALVCLAFLRLSWIENLSNHPISTIPERDQKRRAAAKSGVG